MHRWMSLAKPCPKLTSKTEDTTDSIRCGKWVLRATKIRRNRAQDPSPVKKQPTTLTKKQLTTPTKKRKQQTSPTSSANSVVGENNVQTPKMEPTQIISDLWTYPITQTFIEVMLDEARKEGATNSKTNRTFNKHQWAAIHAEFERRTNRIGYSLQQLKEKFTRLKHEYRVFEDLRLRKTGLGWDEATQTVTAPEHVWQEYVQGHKDAAKFRHKGLDHFDLLQELLEGSLATGAFAQYPSTLGGPTVEGERAMMREGKSIRKADVMSMDSRGKRKSEGSGGTSSKSVKIDHKDEAYGSLALAQKKKAEYFDSLLNARLQDVSIDTCVDALNEIRAWVDEDQYYKAFNKLTEGLPVVRQGFMKLEPDQRIGWVNRLI